MSSFQQLYSVLQAEHRTATQLLTILTEERAALVHTDPDKITELTASEQPLVVQLEQLSRQRETVLQVDGFSSGKEGLEAFIGNQGDRESAKLNKLMAALKRIAFDCQEHNQINGGIVNVNRKYLHCVMSILHDRDMEVTAYGPGGEYTNQIVRQTLIGRFNLLLTPTCQCFNPFRMVIHARDKCQFVAAGLFEDFLSANSDFFKRL
jgi:flagellar biosynthesis protein FlgN